eukprot:7161119-Pyramimonas_sp.AAC.1
MWRLKPLRAPQPHVVGRQRGRCSRRRCPLHASLAVSAINGIGVSRAGAVASVACTALAGEAGCPAAVVVRTAVIFIAIAVKRFSSSRRSLSSLAPRSISPWRFAVSGSPAWA